MFKNNYLRHLVIFVRGAALAGLLLSTHAFAQVSNSGSLVGAQLLPQGRFAVIADVRTTQADREYNANGQKQALLSRFDNFNLTSAAFPLLAAFGPGATLGTSRLSASYSGTQERVILGYGLTENVTVGVAMGYGEVRSKVNTTVSGGNLAANPLFNPAAPIGGANVPFVPLGAFGLTRPVGAADVQNILTSPAFGLNYKPIQNTSWQGALDPIIGLRWRVHKSDDSSTVLAPFLRIGMAKQTDPNDLMQTSPADGTTDLALGATHSRRLGSNGDLTLAAQYTVQFADHVWARRRSVNESLVPSSRLERMRRDRSDPIELTAEAGYRMGDWRLSGRVEYATGGRDKYRSPLGLDTSGLEFGSDYFFTLGFVGLTWSGVRGYLAGEKLPPLILSLQYGRTLAARNTSAPEFLTLTASLPF